MSNQQIIVKMEEYNVGNVTVSCIVRLDNSKHTLKATIMHRFHLTHCLRPLSLHKQLM